MHEDTEQQRPKRRALSMAQQGPVSFNSIAMQSKPKQNDINARLKAEIQRALSLASDSVIARVFKHGRRGPNLDSHLIDVVCTETGARKPLAFFMKAEGAAMFADTSCVYKSLVRLGLPAPWINQKLQQGFMFSLLLVNDRLSYDATWDGLLDGFAAGVPECQEYVTKYRDECKTNRTFYDSDEFKVKYGSCDAVDLCCHTDAKMYLTPRRFLNNTERSFIDFRVLIWIWGCANAHFTGTGYTIDALTQEHGVAECLVPNMPLREMIEIHKARLIPLQVDVPPNQSAVGSPSC